LAWPVALALLVIGCFLPALRADFVNWDDDLNFTNNKAYRGLSLSHLRWMFTTVQGGNYQPLSWLTLGLDYTLWGMDPAGYHLTSVLLHATNAVLVYLLVQVLLRRAGAEPVGLRAAAAVGALFFAVHPLRVESVAWVTERRDVLCGVFYLLTVLGYLWMEEAKREGRPWRGLLFFSLGCFALSLLAKAWGMTLPAVLLLLDVYPLRRFPDGRGRRVLLLEKVPYALLAFAGFLLTLRAFAPFQATRTLAEHGVFARAAQAAYGLVFYVWKTLVPLRLSPLYVLEEKLDPSSPPYLLAFALVIAVTVALVLLRHRWPWALAAWACYTLIVFPALGFAGAGPQIAADRFTYLACLPWAVLVAAGFHAAYRSPGLRRRALAVTTATALAVLAALTVAQTRIWWDSGSLWEHVLRLDPDNYVAHVHRGEVRRQARNLDGALIDLDEAIRLNPRFPGSYGGRGFVRQLKGDLNGALEDYAEAIRLFPNYVDVYCNRADVRVAQGDLEGAEADFSQALAIDAGYARAYDARASVRQRKGDAAGAEADYTEVLRLDPAYPGARYNRGLSRYTRGDLDGAIVDYTEALRANPRSSRSYNNRGAAHETKGDLARAAADYGEALRLQPRDPGTWANRARVRRALGDLDGARGDYAEALRIAPPDWPYREAIEKGLGGRQ
jgi:tetratricopeptide (TPR) repeat protein